MGCDIHIFPEAYVEDGGYWELIMDIDLERYVFDKRTNEDPEKHNHTIYSVVDKPRTIYVTFPNIFDMNIEGEDISIENYYRLYYSKQLGGVDKIRFESRDYDLFSLLADVRSDEEEERPSEYLPFCGYGWESDMSYALYDLWNIAYDGIDFHSHVVYNVEDLLDDDFIHQCEENECGYDFISGVKKIKEAIFNNFPEYSDLRFNICFDN